MDGGATFQQFSAPATVAVQVSSHPGLDSPSTRFFDTEMLSLSLSGGSLPAGVMVRESPSKASLGRTSVRQNPPTGQFYIGSFFDVFTEISLDGGATWSPQTNHPGTVALKQPEKNPVEIDSFPKTTAEVTLQYADGTTETVSLQGPTTVQVNIPPSGQAFDSDGNGLDQVATEMTAMSLTGNSSMGPVSVSLDSAHHSLGQIEENANNTPGTLDIPPFTATGSANSYFDLYLSLQINGQTLYPASPVRMQSTITHKPPA